MDAPNLFDSEFQVLLFIRGKILNVEKASMDKSHELTKIRKLFTAMGTGFGAEFDVSKARYQKLVFWTDAPMSMEPTRIPFLTLIFIVI